MKKITDLPQRVNYFRNKAGISASELSFQLNKHSGYISKLESIDFNVPSSVLMEIINILGVSGEEFFAEDYKNYSINRELYNLILSLPQDKKQTLLNFLKS